MHAYVRTWIHSSEVLSPTDIKGNSHFVQSILHITPLMILLLARGISEVPRPAHGEEEPLLSFTFSHDLGAWVSHLHNLPRREELSDVPHRSSGWARCRLTWGNFREGGVLIGVAVAKRSSGLQIFVGIYQRFSQHIKILTRRDTRYLQS